MKKLLLAGSALALLAPPVAQAEMNLQPYIGFDIQRTDYSYNGNYGIGGGLALDGDTVLEDVLYGGNIHIGSRVFKNFGVELGYFRNREESENISAGDVIGPGTVAAADFSTDIKTHGFTLDGLGYLPVAERFELIGTAGLSWTDAEIELSVPGAAAADADEDEFGYRIGAGGQFHITDRLNARGLVRYQYADFDNVADNAWTASIGLNYSF